VVGFANLPFSSPEIRGTLIASSLARSCQPVPHRPSTIYYDRFREILAHKPRRRPHPRRSV